MLPTTAYLLLDHMATNKGILGFSGQQKVIFLAGLTILKGEVSVQMEWMGG